MAVPGMADGRSMGTRPYASSSLMTTAYQQQHGLASAHALREHLQRSGVDVMRPTPHGR